MTSCPTCGREQPGGFLFCPFCGAAIDPADGSDERRKLVTVLFCDVTGSTALGERLDPESLRRAMARYLDAMKQVIERHGGTVEKFIGDAVLAVFGVPAVHEDDALRALRAAAEMREALVDLNTALDRDFGATFELRIGVNSGEVVTGTDERLVTGDAVNVAARLEQAAQPGETLIGEPTVKLAGNAVETEPVEPLELKGKSERVPAWRLLSVARTPSERRSDSPIVGRREELEALDAAWERVRAGRCCELVTIVGAAGVGKSRLVAEFLAQHDGAVVRGRCLSYGDGITYWPVIEVVKQLDQQQPVWALDPSAEAALSGLLANSGDLTTDELPWAFRKLLEAAAGTRPLIVVFDDIQWGDDAFLDLLEHIAYVATDSPILLACMSRPELLDRRGGWGGVLRLEPLEPDEAGRLIDARLAGRVIAPEVRDRLVAGSGGNPLFAEELAAMPDTGEGMVIPGTLQALLGARLDQLDPAERAVLERAAVEGEVFHRSALRALAPDDPQLVARLTSLVRKELIRPERAQIAGDDAFRFRHLLIRDAAYDALAKARRAELHERLAAWVESDASNLGAGDELVGYHLEQAYRYLGELGPADEHAQRLAKQAAERLRAAGGRADARGDLTAAISLLGRAAELLPRDAPERPELLTELGVALSETWRSGEAERVANEAVELARDPQTHARAILTLLEVQWRQTDTMTSEMEESLAGAIRTLERVSDDRGLAQAWHLVGRRHQVRLELTETQSAYERALIHARRAGDARQETWLRIVSVVNLIAGRVPVTEIEPLNDENLARATVNHSRRGEAAALSARGRLLAMQGHTAEGRALVADGRTIFEELGIKMAVAGSFGWAVEVEERGGDVAAALAAARAGAAYCERIGNERDALEFNFSIARLAALDGDHEEPERVLTDYEEASAAVDDPSARIDRGLLRGRVAASRGRAEEAARFVQETVELLRSGYDVAGRADWLLDAGWILSAAGRDTEALPLVEEARALYELKGDVAMAARAAERLSRLRALNG